MLLSAEGATVAMIQGSKDKEDPELDFDESSPELVSAAAKNERQKGETLDSGGERERERPQKQGRSFKQGHRLGIFA